MSKCQTKNGNGRHHKRPKKHGGPAKKARATKGKKKMEAKLSDRVNNGSRSKKRKKKGPAKKSASRSRAKKRSRPMPGSPRAVRPLEHDPDLMEAVTGGDRPAIRDLDRGHRTAPAVGDSAMPE